MNKKSRITTKFSKHFQLMHCKVLSILNEREVTSDYFRLIQVTCKAEFMMLSQELLTKQTIMRERVS